MAEPATHLGYLVQPVAPRLPACVACYWTGYCRNCNGLCSGDTTAAASLRHRNFSAPLYNETTIIYAVRHCQKCGYTACYHIRIEIIIFICTNSKERWSTSKVVSPTKPCPPHPNGSFSPELCLPSRHQRIFPSEDTSSKVITVLMWPLEKRMNKTGWITGQFHITSFFPHGTHIASHIYPIPHSHTQNSLFSVPLHKAPDLFLVLSRGDAHSGITLPWSGPSPPPSRCVACSKNPSGQFSRRVIIKIKWICIKTWNHAQNIVSAI